MKVKMLTATHWNGKRLNPDDTVEVTKDVAVRWEDVGIAEPAETVDTGSKSIERMTTDELSQKAAELGLDISGATTNKQRAEAILAHLAEQAKE